MPKATFYTHVAEPAVFSCRLAARAMRDSRVLVWSDSAETVARIDRDLWQFDPESFIPHEIWPAGSPVPSETPVLLASGFELPELPHGFAVLNLSPDFWSDAPAPPVRPGPPVDAPRDARDRHLTRENVPLADVLAGQVTISRAE